MLDVVLWWSRYSIAMREGCQVAVQWVVSQVASGVTITQLAKEVAAMELPGHPAETFSRNWFSMIANRLEVSEGEAPAKEQIANARREAAYALLDEALIISDEPADDSASVQRNRLRSDVRLRMAALWNRDELGDRSGVTVNLDLGALHLDALRRRSITHNRPTPLLEAGEGEYMIE